MCLVKFVCESFSASTNILCFTKYGRYFSPNIKYGVMHYIRAWIVFFWGGGLIFVYQNGCTVCAYDPFLPYIWIVGGLSLVTRTLLGRGIRFRYTSRMKIVKNWLKINVAHNYYWSVLVFFKQNETINNE